MQPCDIVSLIHHVHAQASSIEIEVASNVQGPCVKAGPKCKRDAQGRCNNIERVRKTKSIRDNIKGCYLVKNRTPTFAGTIILHEVMSENSASRSQFEEQ